jgi:hypothetical protein
VRVHQTNPGWLARLRKIYSGPDAELAIGWPRGTAGPGLAYPDGTQVALVAAVQNFGSGSRGIPARPFLAVGAKDAVTATAPIAKALAPALNAGKISKAGILEHMGTTAVDAVKNRITAGPWEPLKAATIADKGSSRPLIDTGLMRNSITHIVREDG